MLSLHRKAAIILIAQSGFQIMGLYPLAQNISPRYLFVAIEVPQYDIVICVQALVKYFSDDFQHLIIELWSPVIIVHPAWLVRDHQPVVM